MIKKRRGKPAGYYREARSLALRAFEEKFLARVLRLARGNLSEAARIAEIDRKHLWRIMRRTGIL
jgi:transcriptional regulator of acetoin/glycerol metabolism